MIISIKQVKLDLKQIKIFKVSIFSKKNEFIPITTNFYHQKVQDYYYLAKKLKILFQN